MSAVRWTVALRDCATETDIKGLGVSIYDEIAARYLYEALVRAGEAVELKRDQEDAVVSRSA